MNVPANAHNSALILFPEDNIEARVVFTWCDFVKYAKDDRSPTGRRGDDEAKVYSGQPAAKVKCVCWDLDNTLWAGILVEDGPDKVAIRPAAIELITGAGPLRHSSNDRQQERL